MGISTRASGRLAPRAGALVAMLLLSQTAFAQELEPVRLQLKWKHQFQFAGYYAAIQKGFYREAGLEVTVMEAADARVGDVVATGGAEYGVEGPDLLRQRAQGQRLIVLAAIFQHAAEVLAVREDAGIRSPQELVGAKVSLPSVGVAAIRAMLAHEGVLESMLNLRPPTAGLEDLIKGDVAARGVYLTDAPFILERMGVGYVLLRPATYGIDFYGDLLFTSEAELANHPDRVRAFREASLRGWKYAMAHPAEIIDAIRSHYHSPLSAADLANEAEAMRSLILPDLVDIGHMNPGRFRHIAETYAELGMMPADHSLEGFLYDPSASPDSRNLRRLALVAGVVGLTGAMAAGFLALFNYRLRKTVQVRTNELHTAATEWRRTFDAIDSPILITDLTGRVLRLNRAALRLAEEGQGEIVGQKIDQLGGFEPWRTTASLLRAAIDNGAVSEAQAHDERLGRRWDVFVRVAEAGDDLEERVIVRLRDITTLVSLQESLRRTERMAAMGSLVAGVAHEVRNPLFSISATLDTLYAEFRSHPSFAECWPVLQSQVGRLTRLMRDLLDYGRPSRSSRKPTQFRDVLKKAIRNCASASEAAGVTIREVTAGTPPFLQLDFARMEQVVENLLSNAIQHSPRGGEVIVAVRENGTSDRPVVQCTVCDGGPGIMPGDLSKVFEPFFTRRAGGTGLGLSISQGIVEGHGGTLTAQHRPEGGAMFTITLPVSTGEDRVATTSPEES